MSLVRKALAKYGAKIPAAPSTGAKQAPQGETGAPVDPTPKAKRVVKEGDAKKRKPR